MRIRVFSAIVLPLAAVVLMLGADKGAAPETHSRAVPLAHAARATQLLGRAVQDNGGRAVGKLDDAVADLQSGRVLYAVLSAGGVLGLGERLLAVPPGAFRQEGSTLRIAADKQKLADAPQYLRAHEQQGQMVSPSFVSSVYRHFGQTSWWQGVSSSSSSGQFGDVQQITALFGKPVRTRAGARLGRLTNVILDLPSGVVACLILSPQSKLGLDGNLYPLPAPALSWTSDRSGLVTEIDREKLSGAPHFSGAAWPDFSSSSLAAQVHRYYSHEGMNTLGMQPTAWRSNFQQRIYQR